MRKELFKVNGYKGNPFELKLTMRNYAKNVVPDVYFKTFDNEFDIKNIGCLLFGQPRTWASVLSFLPDLGTNRIEILLDKRRFSLVSALSEEELKEILSRVLEKLKSLELITSYESLP